MRVRAVAVAAFLLGCGAPSPVRGPVPIRSAPPSVTSAVGPLVVPIRSNHESVSPREKHRRRCTPHEGDPDGWRVFAPFDATWEVIAATLSFCNWSVSLENGLPVARVNERKRREVTLPFEPSRKPRYQFVRCRCDPEAEANDPPQRVTDYVASPLGYLVAYDSGEFGGGLSWFDESGTFRQTAGS